MKSILLAITLLTFNHIHAQTCPLMIGDEIDLEESVTIQDTKIYMCCGSCVSKFEENAAYYIKASKDLYAKFTAKQLAALGVDKVKLLEQKFCPIYPERLINPNSPTAEYKGKTIYFWSTSALRRWKRDPEKYYQEAKTAGVL